MDQATNQTQLNWRRRTFPDTDKWRHRERERERDRQTERQRERERATNKRQ